MFFYNMVYELLMPQYLTSLAQLNRELTHFTFVLPTEQSLLELHIGYLTGSAKVFGLRTSFLLLVLPSQTQRFLFTVVHRRTDFMSEIDCELAALFCIDT